MLIWLIWLDKLAGDYYTHYLVCTRSQLVHVCEYANKCAYVYAFIYYSTNLQFNRKWFACVHKSSDCVATHAFQVVYTRWRTAIRLDVVLPILVECLDLSVLIKYLFVMFTYSTAFQMWCFFLYFSLASFFALSLLFISFIFVLIFIAFFPMRKSTIKYKYFYYVSNSSVFSRIVGLVQIIFCIIKLHAALMLAHTACH